MLFFSVIGFAFVWLSLANSDDSLENPLLAATASGVLFSAFILLGLYLVIFSRNYKLVIDASSIIQSGAFSTRRIVISEIEKATWRNWPAGYSIKLQSKACCLTVEFGTIELEHRQWLIDFLRSAIPGTKQLNWDKFLLHSEVKAKRKVMSPFQRAMVFYGLAVSLLVAWICGMGAVNLVGSIMNLGFATFLLTRKSSGNKEMDRSDGSAIL
jgi:hypothetical protein